MRVDAVVLGIIATVLSIVVGIVATVLSQVLADECKAWMPWLAGWIIRRATASMPKDQRTRYTEEWQSHIGEIPGSIAKIFTAADCFARAAWAAKRMSSGALSDTSTALAVSGKMETSGHVFPRLVRQCASCGKTFPVAGNKILGHHRCGADLYKVRRLKRNGLA